MTYLYLTNRQSHKEVKKWSGIVLKTLLFRYEIPVIIILRALGFEVIKFKIRTIKI